MRTSKNHFFDFENLDFAQSITAYELLGKVVTSSSKVNICSIIDARDEKTNLLSKNLLQLYRSDRTIQEERGAKDLQIGFPFVQGKLNDGSVIRGPLLFFAVELDKNEKNWTLQRVGEPVFNNSFLLAYEHFNGVKLNEDLSEVDFSDFKGNIDDFILYLYNYLKDCGLVLNFNQSLFAKRISHFANFTKEDLELLPFGELKLQPNAILGIFPQAGSLLAQDYSELIENFELQDSKLDQLFRNNDSSLNKVKERSLHLPLAIDASQEAIVREINNENSIVVQGPPGSGKSQLIANIMADFAAKGKRVLLVCQKRAALDVVYERLSGVGMKNFAALVHDYKQDRKSLYEQVAFQVNQIDDYKKNNLALDAIFLEREFDQVSLQIEKNSEELEGFRTALYDGTRFGKSPKELYLLAAKPSIKAANIYDLGIEISGLSYESLETLKTQFRQIAAYKAVLEEDSEFYAFWEGSKKAYSWTSTHQNAIHKIIDNSLAINSQFNELGLTGNVERNQFFEELGFIKDFRKEGGSLGEISNPKSKEQIFRLESFLTEKVNSKIKIEALSKSNLEELEKTVFEFKAKLEKGFISKLILSFSTEWKRLILELKNYDLSPDKRGLIEFLSLISDARSFKSFQKDDGFNDWEGAQTCLQKAKKARFIHDLIAPKEEFKDLEKSFPLREKMAIDHKLNLDEWSNYVVLDDLSGVNEELKSYFKENFDKLVAFSDLLKGIGTSNINLLNRFKNENDLEKSILHAFIDELEIQYPILKACSSLKLSQLENELQEAVVKKQKLSQEKLLITLRNETYRHLEKNRLGNTVSYRELSHQVNKKKRIWPIRKVLSEFNEDIFRLIPCWMASPETVSSIFPMQKYFDLVIFDEASQCYAENGLPSMLRAKQVMVAGDAKQLQPSDLYRVRYEDEQEDDFRTEVDSLLDLAQSFLPSAMLQGHYRSKSLDLIQFSNQHFYEGKLQMLPHFDHFNKNEASISYIKVDGTWESQKNEVEAQKVAEIVRNLSAENPTKKIGVVTFNHPQSQLIIDLVDLPNLSVKNIENIQGDEFDYLIFSIAYAPDEKGKLRANFGTLGQSGGENRLNVAITRAIEKVIIVSSILPEDLAVEQSLNLGPKLLKQYLAYAWNISNMSTESGKETDTELSNKERNLSLLLSTETMHATSKLPFADLVEKEDGVYRSLVLTDDNLFYQSFSAKDAFAYKPLLLKSKNWSFTRSWSREYWRR